MSAPVPISAELAAAAQRLLGHTWLDANAAAFEQGNAWTKRAAPRRPNRHDRRSLQFERRAPRRHDRSAARQHRRWLALTMPVPPSIGAGLTDSQMAYARLVRDGGGTGGGYDRSLDESADRTKTCRKTMQRAQERLLELGLIVVEHRPVLGAKHLTNIIRIVSKEWLAWIARCPSRSPANIGGQSSPTSESRNHRDREKKAETDEAVQFAEELANIAGYRRNAVPQAWRDSNPPRVVQGWIDMLQPFRDGLPTNVIQLLRRFCCDMMQKKTGHRPYSPRYFSPQFQRFAEELRDCSLRIEKLRQRSAAS